MPWADQLNLRCVLLQQPVETLPGAAVSYPLTVDADLNN